jgi:A/G-specific adenine glycosylase
VNDRYFRERLRVWGAENRRDLPWVGERDPYRIWLSETLLQQTRVEQGMPYYRRFLAAFPRVEDLAAAEDDRVFKLWEGLGYYNRARNLLKAARIVANERNGRFPDTLEGLRALPGVGAYTAAAVASFAYGLPHAVVDGNVYRVLARWHDLDLEVPSAAAARVFAEKADAVLDRADPAAWNQAMMDFGALCCTPRNPDCGACPVADGCLARLAGTVAERPVKKAKAPRRARRFRFLVLRRGDRVAVARRGEGDVWAGLWTFPALEEDAASGETPPAPEALLERAGLLPETWAPAGSAGPWRQLLSHQDVRATAHHFRARRGKTADGGKDVESLGAQWVAAADLRSLAFPRMLTRYLASPEAYV